MVMPWQQEVVRANVHHGRLIATMVDSGYEPFVLNWCAGLDALGLAEYVVVALDRSVWMMLNAGCASTVGCHRQHAIHYGSNPEEPSRRLASARQRRRAVSWYDDEYRQLMGAVPRRLLTLLSYGDFDLLLTDADVLWRRSPWPSLAPGGQGSFSFPAAQCEVLAIEGRPSQVLVPDAAATTSAAAELPAHDSTTGPTIVQQKHPLANCPRCLNAGFVFLRRTPAVAELLRRWATQLEARHAKDQNQKWLNWVLATGGSMRPESPAALALFHNGTGGWAGAPRACQLQPRLFANGHALRAMLPLLSPSGNCSCGAVPRRGKGVGGRGGGVAGQQARACVAQRSALLASLRAAHLNFALSAAEKVCLAKSLGLWLLSEPHRRAFDGASPRDVASAVAALPPGVTEVGVDEGRVAMPSSSRRPG